MARAAGTEPQSSKGIGSGVLQPWTASGDLGEKERRPPGVSALRTFSAPTAEKRAMWLTCGRCVVCVVCAGMRCTGWVRVRC